MMTPIRRRRSRRANRDTATTTATSGTTHRKRKANNDNHELQERTNIRDEEDVTVTRPNKRARKDVNAAWNADDDKKPPSLPLQEGSAGIRLEEYLKSLSIAEAKVQGKIDLALVQPTHCVRIGGHASALHGYEVILLESTDTSAAGAAAAEAVERDMPGNDEKSDQDKKSDRLVLVQLIKNARGKKMKYLAVKEILMSDLEPCGVGSTATHVTADGD